MNYDLPLFPLGQPLFPGVRLNLQIFEQRYIQLVRMSLREDKPFGIVAIAEGNEAGEAPEIYSVGLQVNIVDWRQQDNGLLGITVAGDRRFEIHDSWIEEDGLLMAEAASLTDDSEEKNISTHELDGLESLLRELANHPACSWINIDDKQMSPQELSWKLSQALPVSVEDKIPLLAESELDVRLELIQNYVDRLSAI